MKSTTLGALLDLLVFRLARVDETGLPKGDRVNIGSAYLTPPGWINLDNSPSVWLSRHRAARYLLEKTHFTSASAQERWRPGIVFHDVRHGLPWAEQSLSFIYTSHLLEHLSRLDGEGLLRECHRVLKPSGILRVVVPDLRYYAQKYLDDLDGCDTDTDRALSATASERFMEIVGVHNGGALSARNPHRWMYDERSLADGLKRVGFVNVAARRYREGDFPDLDKMDTRPIDSLHMEAVKA